MLQQTPQQLIDILSISNKKFNDHKELTNYVSENSRLTHTQCVFHIIRLRLIIFHTPKFFSMAIFTLIFFYKFFFMYVYHA